MKDIQVKTLLKKRAHRALCIARLTPEQRLLWAIIERAIDDHDRPRADQRSAISLLNSWYPSWQSDKAQIEQYFLALQSEPVTA